MNKNWTQTVNLEKKSSSCMNSYIEKEQKFMKAKTKLKHCNNFSFASVDINRWVLFILFF